jgi:H+/Cl- antiporter ClcA
MVVLVAAGLGALGALVTVGFVKLLEELHELLWDDLPDAWNVGATSWKYVVPVCVVGGVVVAFCRRYLGEWPRDLQESLAVFRRDREFDYRHLPQSLVAALAALVFGAALGPEAVLVALMGGIASWIASVIRAGRRATDALEVVGLASALGGLFGTAGAAVIPVAADEHPRRARVVWLFFPALVAAGAGAWVFSELLEGGYLDFTLRPYDFAFGDLFWAALATLAGVAVAALLLALLRALRRTVPSLLARPEAAVVGGLGLGLLAVATSLTLFSGHDGIQIVLDDTDADAWYLVGVAVAKMAAAALLLATGWRGGRFFPVLFAGAAAGLALSTALPDVPSMVAVAAAMTAGTAVLLRRAVPAAILLMFLFPYDLYPAVVVGALLGAFLGRRLVGRWPALDELEPTPRATPA